MEPIIININMYDFFGQLRENIEALKKQNVQTVFTIATTSKKEIDPYLTPIRKNEHLLFVDA